MGCQMSCRIKAKRNFALFRRSAENLRIVELRSEISNLVGRKVAQIGPNRC